VTLTITVRVPPVGAAGAVRLLRAVLPIAEPAVLLVADAAGLGLAGQIICATAVRSARRLLGC
jgi:hypothetical protein